MPTIVNDAQIESRHYNECKDPALARRVWLNTRKAIGPCQNEINIHMVFEENNWVKCRTGINDSVGPIANGILVNILDRVGLGPLSRFRKIGPRTYQSYCEDGLEINFTLYQRDDRSGYFKMYVRPVRNKGSS